jgi:hypothetical protein
MPSSSHHQGASKCVVENQRNIRNHQELTCRTTAYSVVSSEKSRNLSASLAVLSAILAAVFVFSFRGREHSIVSSWCARATTLQILLAVAILALTELSMRLT